MRPDWKRGDSKFDDQSRGQKRRKYEDNNNNKVYSEAEETENRLRALIVRIGDKSGTSGLTNNLESFSDALETDLAKHRSAIIDTIIKCVMSLPVKISVYATLVALLNLKNFDFGAELIQTTHKHLQVSFQMLQSKNPLESLNDIKMILRFLGELANANFLHPTNVLHVLQSVTQILDANIDPQNYVLQQRKLLFAELLLEAIPWCGKELSIHSPNELSDIISRIGKFLNTTTELQQLSLLDSGLSSDGPTYLKSLFDCVHQTNAQKSWQDVHTIAKPYTAFQSKLNGSIHHNFGQITIPEFYSFSGFGGFHCLQRHLGIQIFARDQEVVTALKAAFKPIEILIVMDYIVDILKHFESNHKEAIKQIQSIPLPPNLPKSFDPEQSSNISNIMDYILMEVLVAQLFLLPVSSFKSVFYATVIIDACKTIPTFPSVFGQTIDLLFDRLESLDVECVHRFSSWFAHHLSNFDYKWNWSAWEYVLKYDLDHVKRLFVSSVLEKCVCLSYWERVRKTIPDNFEVMMPQKPVPHFPFEQESAQYHFQFDLLQNAMRNKETVDNLIALVDNDPEKQFSVPHVEKLRIIIHAFLKISSKSFSHLLALLERYASFLKVFFNNEESRTLLIEECNQIWSTSFQHVLILLERFLNYGVVDPRSIIAWCFQKKNHPLLIREDLWAAIEIALNKVVTKVDALKDELRTAQEDVEQLRSEERNATAAEVKRLQDRQTSYDAGLAEMCSVLCMFFQRLWQGINDHFDSVTTNVTVSDPWLHLTFGYFKAFARKYHQRVTPTISEIQASLNFEDFALHDAATPREKLVHQAKDIFLQLSKLGGI